MKCVLCQEHNIWKEYLDISYYQTYCLAYDVRRLFAYASLCTQGRCAASFTRRGRQRRVSSRHYPSYRDHDKYQKTPTAIIPYEQFAIVSSFDWLTLARQWLVSVSKQCLSSRQISREVEIEAWHEIGIINQYFVIFTDRVIWVCCLDSDISQLAFSIRCKRNLLAIIFSSSK